MLGHIPEFDRGIKRARFAVLRHTKIPAILVEGGFLTETGDSKRIADPAWRKNLAESICTGIENYRNLVEKKQRPMLVADYRAQNAGQITLVDLMQPPSRLESSPPSAIIPVTNPSTTSTPAPEREP
jgi:hypothetical protein